MSLANFSFIFVHGYLISTILVVAQVMPESSLTNITEASDTSNQKVCLWTGCQLNSWLEVGCYQFNRIEKNRRNCTDGYDYYCCSDSSNLSDDVSAGNRRIVGYYTSWGQKNISSCMIKKLTHVIYAYVGTDINGAVTIDTTNDRLDKLIAMKSAFPHIKVLFSVGGEGENEFFRTICTSKSKRSNFTSSIINLLEEKGLDGIDIDWIYPTDDTDRKNHVSLMRDLRIALDTAATMQQRNSKYLISFVGASDEYALLRGFDLYGAIEHVDFVNIASYDYNGDWNTIAGPVAPLLNVHRTMKYYVCKTGLAHKLNMGVPFFGRYWMNVGNTSGDDDLYRKSEPIDDKITSDAESWSTIKDKYTKQTGFDVKFHMQAKVSYAYNRNSKIYIGYEDIQSVKEKVKYAADHNIGGLMIWSIDKDDEQLSLLDSLSKTSDLMGRYSFDIRYHCVDKEDSNCFSLKLNDANSDVIFKWRQEKIMNETVCEPLEKVVKLIDRETPISALLWPRFVKIKRCDGGCDINGLRECLPTETYMHPVIRYKKSDFSYHSKESYSAHSKCDCLCKVRKENCNLDVHIYEEDRCRCTCKNEYERDVCNMNRLKKWKHDECTCKCKRVKHCSSQSFFSQDTCSCRSM